MPFRRLMPLPLVPALAMLATSAVGCQVPRDTIDVLYVGNSYIYFNNLPDMVEGISNALDGPVVRGVAHTHGGETLRGHLEDGHLDSILPDGPGRGDWDWVLLQEQSTLGAEMDAETGVLGDPEDFHGATRELVALIREEGASAALYMTWAKEPFPNQSEALSQAYRSIGTELGVRVAAVGDAFAEARRIRPDLGLYLSDGSHPNPAGSYLAACVIYAMVTGTSPVGAPRELAGRPWDFGGVVESESQTILVSLSASDADFLQGIAWRVVSPEGDGEQ